MKYIFQLCTLGLAISFSMPAINHDAKNAEFKEALRKQEEQKEKDEVKSNIALGIFGATAITAAGSVLSQRPAFKGTGLDVGIPAGAILASLSVFFDGKKAEGFRNMAITAPILAAMGAGLNSEKVMGNINAQGIIIKGYLSEYGMFGINTLAENALKDPSKRAAFLSLAVIASYIAVRPYLDGLTGWVARKTSDTYAYIVN